MATVVSSGPILAAPPSLWRMSVDGYLGMIAHGLFKEGDRVELLDGLLVSKMRKNSPHTLATQLTRDVLKELAPTGWFSASQDPVVLATSVPEPDVALVRGAPRDYAQNHPSAADVALVAEIADTSLDRDRGAKLAAYALAGIPVYWIVDLIDRQIEVHTDPTPQGDYLHRHDYQPGDTVPVIVDGQLVGHCKASDCLP